MSLVPLFQIISLHNWFFALAYTHCIWLLSFEHRSAHLTVLLAIGEFRLLFVLCLIARLRLIYKSVCSSQRSHSFTYTQIFKICHLNVEIGVNTTIYLHGLVTFWYYCQICTVSKLGKHTHTIHSDSSQNANSYEIFKVNAICDMLKIPMTNWNLSVLMVKFHFASWNDAANVECIHSIGKVFLLNRLPILLPLPVLYFSLVSHFGFFFMQCDQFSMFRCSSSNGICKLWKLVWNVKKLNRKRKTTSIICFAQRDCVAFMHVCVLWGRHYLRLWIYCSSIRMKCCTPLCYCSACPKVSKHLRRIPSCAVTE